jgi:hypothetical protein
MPSQSFWYNIYSNALLIFNKFGSRSKSNQGLPQAISERRFDPLFRPHDEV